MGLGCGLVKVFEVYVNQVYEVTSSHIGVRYSKYSSLCSNNEEGCDMATYHVSFILKRHCFSLLGFCLLKIPSVSHNVLSLKILCAKGFVPSKYLLLDAQVSVYIGIRIYLGFIVFIQRQVCLV